jgi:translation initiation factor 4G
MLRPQRALIFGHGVSLEKASVTDFVAGNPQPINFGSLDSPTTTLSSSPAAPSIAGAHLDANSVKSFGSIEADATAAAQRSSTGVAGPAANKKPLDMHALFGAGAPTTPVEANAGHERRSSMTGSAGAPSFQMPASGPAQHLRPPSGPNQPRSPTLGNQMPQPQAFRPMNSAPNRMNGQTGHAMSSASRGPALPGTAQVPYGMHPGHAQQYQSMGGYPAQSGYYVSTFAEQ